MTVRPARPPDIPEIVRVINAAYRVEDFFVHGDRTSAAAIKAILDRPDATVLVIDGAGGALVGAVMVEIRGESGYFGMLSVDPAEQGKGHSRALLEGIEEHCRAAGCTQLEITVVNLRTELPAYYARLGFVEQGTAPFNEPEKLKKPAHLVLMTRPIA